MRALCSILSAVDADSAARCEPELAVLVVRASDGIPGQGWWVGARAHERGYSGPWEGPEARRFIQSVQAETFAWWKSHSGTGADRGAD